jgi:hypothetical protein
MLWKPLRLGALPLLLVLCVPAAHPQEVGDAPKAAMVGDSVAALQSSAPADIPDTRPVAGVQTIGLGSQATSHSFLLPSFGVTTQVQFNPYNSGSAGNPSPGSTTYLSGRLALNKISARSELLLDYLTAGGFANYPNGGSSAIQSLDFAETIRGGRWTQTFGEQFTYLPASSFNFGGMGGLGNFGVGLGGVGVAPGFRQDLVPNQSILTNGAARISNSALAQTTYALGYRSSLSFFGTYGTLHFLDGGLQNGTNIASGAGYNYLLSPLNSMSLSYGFSRFTFSQLAVGAESHTALISFARRITGRLGFQVGAGPDFQVYRSPLAGPRSTFSWALNSGLNYQLRNWETGFNYSHSLTGGSGVLPGAETDMFSGRIGRAFGSWQASVSAGYSRNKALLQTSFATISPQGWYGGAQVNRRFVSFGSLFISYNASGQSSLAAVCPLPACATNRVTQTVSLGYNWGFRPIVLQ